MRTLIPIVCLIVLGCQQPPASNTVKVKVYRHLSVACSDAEADRMLSAMSNVLRDKDSPGDVSVAITFVRDGSVQILPAGIPAVIQTSAHFDSLVSAPPGVKIVRAINWCGGIGAGIIGCAEVPSESVNVGVVRVKEAHEGILLAHEIGHNCGLHHRTDKRDALMYPIVGDNKVVNAKEAEAFRKRVAASASMLSCDDVDGVPVPADIREFVKQRWVHGIPPELARKYKHGDAKKLVEMLESGEYEEHLPNIITTICMIGGDEEVPPILNFLSTPPTSQEMRSGKHAAVLHLAKIIDRTGNKDALQFLAGLALQPAFAAAVVSPAPVADGSGVVPPTEEELADELAVSAVIGLSQSKHPEAASVLGDVAQDGDVSKLVRQTAMEAAKSMMVGN